MSSRWASLHTPGPVVTQWADILGAQPAEEGRPTPISALVLGTAALGLASTAARSRAAAPRMDLDLELGEMDAEAPSRSAPVTPQNFASASAWEDAYAAPGGTDVADWLLPYEKGSALKTALQSALLPVDRASRVLELGSGTSDLASQLVCDGGFLDVTGSDLSPTAVEAARLAPHNRQAMTLAGAKLRFEVADPSPANHAILAHLTAGETVYQAGELPKTP